MSDRHQNVAIGFMLSVLFSAFVFLLPTPAVSEENAVRKDLYISSPDVRLLQKGGFGQSRVPGLEPIEKYGSFFGLKITLKPQGGWNTFSGGDIEKGIGALFDYAAADISASGTTIVESIKESTHAGLEAGGDLIYAITPLFGIGIGAANIRTRKDNRLVFLDEESWPQILQIEPEIKVSAFRAGLFYSFPFAGRLAISVHGGPALYSAEYSFSMGGSASFLRDGLIHTGYFQKAKSKQMGFEGGLGFEFNANPFVAIFVEAQGRYAKIGGFEGEEKATFYQNNQFQTAVRNGPAYFVDTVPYPQLDIVPAGGAVPGSARRATLNFSGVSILAGLKLRL